MIENLMILLIVSLVFSGTFAVAAGIFEHLIPWLAERKRQRKLDQRTMKGLYK